MPKSRSVRTAKFLMYAYDDTLSPAQRALLLALAAISDAPHRFQTGWLDEHEGVFVNQLAMVLTGDGQLGRNKINRNLQSLVDTGYVVRGKNADEYILVLEKL